MGKNRDLLNEMGREELIVFENPDYDSAIIGISHDDRVVYSFEKMIKWLMMEDNITEEEAIEFIEYNTIRAIPYFGPNAPIVLMDEIMFEDYVQDSSEETSLDNSVEGNG